MIDKLKEIRNTARKMQESYLRGHGLFDFIERETIGLPEKWKMKEKIDYIIEGKPQNFCHCGSILKIGQKYCSAQCTGRAPEVIQKISVAQRENKKERAEKTRTTMLRKYGVTHNNHLPHCKESRKKKKEIWIEETKRKTFEKYGLDISNFDSIEKLKEIISLHNNFADLQEKSFNNMSVMTIYRHMCSFGIKKIYETKISAGESQLRNFIEPLGLNVVFNDRKILDGYEIDILIPEKGIGLEFNGIYFHSEKKNPDKPDYHKMKCDKALSAGIELISVFEHHWFNKKAIVQSMIKAKLGIFDHRLYARNCIVKEISHKEAADFFEENHLQGSCASSVRIGLYLSGSLVCCASFGKSRFDKNFDWELIRFASSLNTSVVGGFSKIIRHFNKTHSGSLVTYCDRNFSSGKTYGSFGKLIRTTGVGYSWCSIKGITLSRHQTQKKKLKKLYPDIYEDEKTENEIMEEAGFFKIYDCGNLVFEL